MTPASGVIGCNGPAMRGIPSMKSTQSFEPSGEKSGSLNEAVQLRQLLGDDPS